MANILDDFAADKAGAEETSRAIANILDDFGDKLVCVLHINLKDKGITGNGHFAMVETNRKEVFEVIRWWIESKVPPTAAQTARG